MGIGIGGRIVLYNGIPAGLYSIERFEALKTMFPKVDVDRFVVPPEVLDLAKNTVTLSGLKALSNTAFDPAVAKPLGYMAVGDGAYNFTTNSRISQKSSNEALYHQVGGLQTILSFAQPTGTVLSGVRKEMSMTFFSENLQATDFVSNNQSEFFINEYGIFNTDGVLYAHITRTNQPFDPLDQVALTVTWASEFTIE